jgi:hypothetical protein
MNPFENQMAGMPGMNQSTNLFSIIINILFGFVLGLIIFLGFKEVLTYGSKLAADLMNLTGYGRQMGGFGFAASAAPYIIIAPIVGLVVKQLSSVRSLKGFGYFTLAVAIGFAIAFFMRGYVMNLM